MVREINFKDFEISNFHETVLMSRENISEDVIKQ